MGVRAGLLGVYLRLGVFHLSVLEAISVVDDVHHLPFIRQRRARLGHTREQRPGIQLVHALGRRPDKLRRWRVSEVHACAHGMHKSGWGQVLMTVICGGVVVQGLHLRQPDRRVHRRWRPLVTVSPLALVSVRRPS